MGVHVQEFVSLGACSDVHAHICLHMHVCVSLYMCAFEPELALVVYWKQYLYISISFACPNFHYMLCVGHLSGQSAATRPFTASAPEQWSDCQCGDAWGAVSGSVRLRLHQSVEQEL